MHRIEKVENTVFFCRRRY